MDLSPEPVPARRTLKLLLEYDGTDFAGWQRQPRERSVQQDLEEALGVHLRERVPVVAAGRTDAGVHAAGQVASLRTASSMALKGIVYGVNALLAEDMRVIAAEEVAPEFHARRDALGKHYRYRILNRPLPSPLTRRTAHWVARPLSTESMAAAAAHLLGRHDFSAFRNTGSYMGDAVRTLSRLDIEKIGDYISIDVEGDGFLYKMVRNIAGTLLRVGEGRWEPEQVPAILSGRDRRAAGAAAPAHGLCLIRVRY